MSELRENQKEKKKMGGTTSEEKKKGEMMRFRVWNGRWRFDEKEGPRFSLLKWVWIMGFKGWAKKPK